MTPLPTDLSTGFVGRLRARDPEAWFELWETFGPILRAQLRKWGRGRIGIETVQDLAEQAARRLAELGFDGVRVRHGDGSRGWPEEASFDAILVTAAASGGTPQALIDQLAPGGRLVIPVERRAAKLSLFGRGSDQELVVIVKGRDGSLTESCHLPVAFVPLIEGGRP